jgi:porin
MLKDTFCGLKWLSKKLLVGAAVSGMALSVYGIARAQSIPNVKLPTSADVHMPGLEQLLLEDGIYPTISYSGQVAGNPSGGQKQGVAYAGRTTFGAAFDLQKSIGIPGAMIHLLFSDDTGTSLSEGDINSGLVSQSLISDPESFQLAIFTYEQKLFHGRVDINFGRTDLNFLYSDLYCDFESRADCGRPAQTAKTVAAPLFPIAVWGGHVLGYITPNIYVKIGIYQPNADLHPVESHGFDFGIKTSGVGGGFDLPVEVGYTYRTPGAATANKYDIGLIDSQVKFSAPFDSAKMPLHDERLDWFIEAQQFVYQAKPNSARGIYLFGYGIFGASGNTQMTNYQLTGGAIWQGPLESRPFDRAGIQFTDIHFNDEFLNFLNAERVKAKGSGFPWSSESLIEANYMIQLTNWLQLEPDLQYLIHPDGLGFATFSNHNLPNAFVVGAQFNIDLATLAGLPSYGGLAQQDNN